MQLPTLSRVKFDGLISREQEARDAVGAVSRRLAELSKSMATASSGDHGSIEHELTRLRTRQSELAFRHKHLADLNALIGDWLANTKSTMEWLKPPKAPLQKGETISAAVTRLRDRIRSLSSERVRVMQAGIPTADLKEQAKQLVESLSKRGCPRIIAEHQRDFNVQFVVAEKWSDEGLHATLPAILAWFDPAGFTKRLHEAIDKLPAPPLVMTSKARTTKLIALEAELLQCEREEEALIEASEEGEGPAIMRRLDADGRAVLGITIVRGSKPQPAEKAQRVRADVPSDRPKGMTEAELIRSFGESGDAA